MAGWPRCAARSTAWIWPAFAAMWWRRARLRAALICAVVSLAADAGSGARASSSRVSGAPGSSKASSAAGK